MRKIFIGSAILFLAFPHNSHAMRGLSLVRHFVAKQMLRPIIAPVSFAMFPRMMMRAVFTRHLATKKTDAYSLLGKGNKLSSDLMFDSLKEKLEKTYDQLIERENESIERLVDFLDRGELFFLSCKDLPVLSAFPQNLVFGPLSCVHSQGEDIWAGTSDDTYAHLIVAGYDYEKCEAFFCTVRNVDELTKACQKVDTMSQKTVLHLFVAPEATIGSNARTVTFIEHVRKRKPTRYMTFCCDVEPYRPRRIIMNARNGELTIVENPQEKK